MEQYVIKFIFYTSGVIGLLLIAFLVVKTSFSGGINFKKKNYNLEIEESLPLSPRKSLYIVKAFQERFLIVSDSSTTTLLAKLNSNESIKSCMEENFQNNKQEEIPIENEIINEQINQNLENSIIKSMLHKIKQEDKSNNFQNVLKNTKSTKEKLK